MKKEILKMTVLAILLIMCSQANATSWRVNSNVNANAQFANLTTAVANASDGDTIFIEWGHYESNSVTINKRLVIIGTGYFLNENGISMMNNNEANLGNISISNEVSLIGCRLSRIYIGYNNVLIDRCYISGVIYVQATINNITIKNSYLYGLSTYLSYSCQNLQFYGNIVIGGCIGDYNGYASDWITNSFIRNNTIVSNGNTNIISCRNSEIVNNIVINTYYSYSNYTINMSSSYNNIIRNNVLSTTTGYGNYTNNVFGATQDSVFKLVGSSDAKYQLKEGSPALGAGEGGEDCGAFDGPYPYVLSGLPHGLPYLYDASIPARPQNNNVHINFKAGIHNDNE